MHLRRPVCLSDGRRDCGAVMAPAEPGSAAASDEQEEEERESTSLDLPGRPQDITALDTLALLLCVSHSDKTQMSLCPSPLGCFIVQSIDIWFNHCNWNNGEAVNKETRQRPGTLESAGSATRCDPAHFKPWLTDTDIT